MKRRPLRGFGGWGIRCVVVLALSLVSLAGFAADEDCTKHPDLWLPENGTPGLADGGVSVQTTTGDVCQGETVTITVTVDNLSCGDAGAFDVTVYYDSAAGLIGTQRVDSLPGCEFTVLTFTWDTSSVPVGEHEIYACADTGGTIVELNESNNCITIDETLIIRPYAPLIDAEKTVSDLNGGSPEPGETLLYEVVLRNLGCGDQEDNAGHEFEDTLPEHLAATGVADATSGTASVVGDEIFWDGAIPAGGSVTITYKAKIDPTTEAGTQICNQGVVHWDSDGDGSNETDTVTDDPDTPADEDPTCITVEITGIAPPISGTIDAPTLSEWGMILLSCLFVLAFGWRLRQRHVTAG